MVIIVTTSCELRNRVSGRSWTTGSSTGFPSWSTPETGRERCGLSGSGARSKSVRLSATSFMRRFYQFAPEPQTALSLFEIELPQSYRKLRLCSPYAREACRSPQGNRDAQNVRPSGRRRRRHHLAGSGRTAARLRQPPVNFQRRDHGVLPGYARRAVSPAARIPRLFHRCRHRYFRGRHHQPDRDDISFGICLPAISPPPSASAR